MVSAGRGFVSQWNKDVTGLSTAETKAMRSQFVCVYVTSSQYFRSFLCFCHVCAYMFCHNLFKFICFVIICLCFYVFDAFLCVFMLSS